MQAARLATRLQREIRMLQTDPPPGVCGWPCNNDLTHLEAQVEGPEETVYAKGIFKLDVHVPERYPFEPPNVKFKTPVYHPNIDSGGRICLDILNMPPKGAWKPSLNIPTILASIGLLLAEPNSDDGLMGEITAEYKYDRDSFESKARKWTNQYAVQNQPKDGMPGTQSSTLLENVRKEAVIGKMNKSNSPERDSQHHSFSKRSNEDLLHGCNEASIVSTGKMQQTAQPPGQSRGPTSNQKLNLSMKLSLGKGGRSSERETSEPKAMPDPFSKQETQEPAPMKKPHMAATQQQTASINGRLVTAAAHCADEGPSSVRPLKNSQPPNEGYSSVRPLKDSQPPDEGPSSVRPLKDSQPPDEGPSSVRPLKDPPKRESLQKPPGGAAMKHTKTSNNVDTSALIVLDSESDEEMPPPRARSRLSLASRKGMKRK